MENRIRRIEEKLDEQGKSVGEIREKIFDGFGDAIERIDKQVIELRRLAEEVNKVNYHLGEQRVVIEKRMQLFIAIAVVVITAATLVTRIFW